MEEEKESVLLSVEKKKMGGVYIKKIVQEGAIKRDIDPCIVRVGIKRKERE